MIRLEMAGSVAMQRVRDKLKGGWTEMPAGVHSALQASAIDLTSHIKTTKLHGQVLKQRSGRLSRSIHAGPVVMEDGAASISVGTNIEYARIHELGGTTKAHVIRAKGRSLRWVDSGGFTFSAKTGKVVDGFVYRREVQHPGSVIPARPYLRPSMEEKEMSIRDRINAAIHKVAADMGGA